MGDTPFTVLERVELAAREQRLTAEAEAEAILAEARNRAAAIEAHLPERVDATVREVRARQAQSAAREIAAIEAELVAVDQPAVGESGDAMEAAVRLIVAAVLGEQPVAAVAATPPRATPVSVAPGRSR